MGGVRWGGVPGLLLRVTRGCRRGAVGVVDVCVTLTSTLTIWHVRSWKLAANFWRAAVCRPGCAPCSCHNFWIACMRVSAIPQVSSIRVSWGTLQCWG
jgi:hypothetical protein